MKKLKLIVNFILVLSLVLVPLGASALTQEDIDAIWEETPRPDDVFDATVTINENNVLWETDMNILGVQVELEDSKAKQWLDFDSLQIKPEFKKFADEIFDFPNFRLGGATAEHTNYMLNLGPMEDRKGSSHIITGKPGTSAQHMGLVEFLKFMYEINPDATFTPCLTITYGTPEDSAHYAQFLLDEADESEWGALRASYGLVEPVKVLAFEMGNEVDIDSGLTNEKTGEYWPEWENNEEYTDFGNWYADLALEHCKAIREVCPEAKFIILGKSHNLRHPSVEAMMRPVIEKMRDYTDYISWHAYYDGVSLVDSHDHAIQIQEIIDEVMGVDADVKMCVTEQARWHNQDTWGHARNTNNFTGALSVAKFYNKAFNVDYVASTNYHGMQGTNNNGWAIFYATDEYGFVNSTIGTMIKTYAKGVGDRVLESSVQSDRAMTDNTSSEWRFSVLATAKDDKELNLILVNEKDDCEINLNFDFQNQYTLKQEIIGTAPNLQSYNPVENIGKDVFRETITEKNEPNFTSYRMPAKSIVILKLESNKKIPQFSESGSTSATEEVPEADAAFKDIQYNWAKNEISLMAEQGYVNGYEDGNFLPNGNITRAEFATVLSKSLELDTRFPNIYFNDISENDWYTTYVNSVFCEGLMNGKEKNKFFPNDLISLEEAIVTAVRAYRGSGYDVENVNLAEVEQTIINPDEISDWAYEDVLYAIGTGILNRVYHSGEQKLSAPANRAQSVALIYYLCNLVK